MSQDFYKIITNLKFLTKIAKFEGEGLGTAYEYLAKYNIILPLIQSENVSSLTIYGLPEKYGFSMDFILVGLYLDVEEIIVLDERDDKLKRFKNILMKIIKELNLNKTLLNKIFIKRFDLITPNNCIVSDLALSCEVLQRFDTRSRVKIAENIAKSESYAIFVPNGKNEAHSKISGLNTLYLNELRNLFPDAHSYGYIDCPPNPPGIKLSRDKNRVVAELSIKEKALIKMLWLWLATMDKRILKKLLSKYHARNSHIIYSVKSRSLKEELV